MNERIRQAVENNPRWAGVAMLLLSALILAAAALQYRQDHSVMGPALALDGLSAGVGLTMILLGRRLWGLHFLAMVCGCGAGICLMDALERGAKLPGILGWIFGCNGF